MTSRASRRAVAAAWAAGLSLMAAVAPADDSTSSATTLQIPHEHYQLDNGLHVILHRDPSQPLVVVNINVDVGSRDEPARRTGFAHLFEHLMFMGTERVPEKMFDQWMESEGGWNNAWTSSDRTDYYDVAPSHALPLLLWMEADRFSALGEQIDQSKLDTQRKVVRNERRQQTENQPYGGADLRLPELLFPEGHPYHHPVIGSHDDLEAAAVSDVKAFFAEHYVPSQISVVVAGDFETAETKALVAKYFDALPKAAAKTRTAPAKPAKLTTVLRETLEDNVTYPKLILSWLSPALYAPGDAALDVVGDVLTTGKASRLYKRLVFDDQLAQEVSAYQGSRQLQSHFDIEIVVRPDVDLAKVEAIVLEELETLRTTPISAAELQRTKNQLEAGFVGRMQALATRASLLNTYWATRREPDWVAEDLQRYLDLDAEEVRATAERVFDRHARVVLTVIPKAEKKEPEKNESAAPADDDTTASPAEGDAP